MSSTWGNKLKISLFGESHGNAIGIVIDGLPPGKQISLEEIQVQMKRRAPGNNNTSTPRKEADSFEIQSGLFNNVTTGAPLCCLIKNTNTKSKDYEKTKDIARPGHADLTGHLKYKGFNDYRGGGHFSGRLTAPIVFAGALCQQILKEQNIVVGSHAVDIASIKDVSFKDIQVDESLLKQLSTKYPCVLDDAQGEKMIEKILEAKNDHDSVGGIIETIILNVPPSLGSPFFESVESRLASFLFSIPAVKGVEFGEGFNFASLKGSQSNDPFIIKDSKIATTTNNCGGILGGITNGMPITFNTAFKPTPSISKKQNSINMQTLEETEISVEGRHDPCIVLRAIPVIESVASIVLLDLLLEG